MTGVQTCALPISICAMILPGISGSFILLILGKYQYIMGCISDLVSGIDIADNLTILAVLITGAVTGILGFSKFLHWMLARWNKETLVVLAGFIIGSLVKIWPWSNTEAIVCAQFPSVAALGEIAEKAAENGIGVEMAQKAFDAAVASHASLIELQPWSAALFALIGFSLVTGIELAGKAITNKKTA